MSMAPGPQKQLVARSLNGLLKQEGARGAPAAFPTLCNRNEHFESVRFSCRGLICQIHPIDLRFIGTTCFYFLLIELLGVTPELRGLGRSGVAGGRSLSVKRGSPGQAGIGCFMSRKQSNRVTSEMGEARMNCQR